jgi:hypothetical protein
MLEENQCAPSSLPGASRVVTHDDAREFATKADTNPPGLWKKNMPSSWTVATHQSIQERMTHA